MLGRVLNCDYHEGPAFVAELERVLKQPSQLALSIWNGHSQPLRLAGLAAATRRKDVLLLISPIRQNAEYPTQGSQILIDELTFCLEIVVFWSLACIEWVSVLA